MVSKSLRSKNFLFSPDATVTRKWGFKSHQMTWNYLPGQEQHYICSHKTDQLVLRRRLRVKSMLAWLMKLNAGRWMESSGWLLFELATKLLGIPKSQSILRFEQKSCSKTKAIVVGLPIFPIEFTCICSRFPLLRKQGGRKWMLWTKLANGIETRPHFSCSHLRGKLANGIENWWVWTKMCEKRMRFIFAKRIRDQMFGLLSNYVQPTFPWFKQSLSKAAAASFALNSPFL